MARTEGEDDDLDGILDSALAEFDDGPPRVPVLGTAAGAEPFLTPPSTNSGVDGKAMAGDASGGAKTEGCAEGVRAFEEALTALNALDPNGASGGPDAGPSEEGDIKLVEEFLKSLSTHFESVGLPVESGGGAAGGGATAADDASRAARAALGSGVTSEGDIDQLTRELEALLAGGGGGLSEAGPCAVPAGAAASGEGAASAAGGGGGEFEKMVESVVGELLSEEILRSPMEQMRDAFGKWLPANADQLSEADAGRYRRQADIVGRICAEYERETCRTGSVMELLQEMQETGAPPPGVMAQLSAEEGAGGGGSNSGEGSAASAFEKLGDCPVQ